MHTELCKKLYQKWQKMWQQKWQKNVATEMAKNVATEMAKNVATEMAKNVATEMAKKCGNRNGKNLVRSWCKPPVYIGVAASICHFWAHFGSGLGQTSVA